MSAALLFYQPAVNSAEEKTKTQAFNVMYTTMMMMMTVANSSEARSTHRNCNLDRDFYVFSSQTWTPESTVQSTVNPSQERSAFSTLTDVFLLPEPVTMCYSHDKNEQVCSQFTYTQTNKKQGTAEATVHKNKNTRTLLLPNFRSR